MGLRGFSMPDDLFFLCILHNIGATSSDRSLTLEEIMRWTSMEAGRIKSNIEKLIQANYVQMVSAGGVEKYQVTANGIRKVLSIYS